jgi:hypothetical protein
MTRQPAVPVGILLFVACDALAHAPDFVVKPLNLTHLTVALLTGDIAVDVALVVEKHVFRYIVDFDPRRWCPGIEVAMFLFDPGIIGNDVIVAVQAFLHRRHSGKIGIVYVGMTEAALNVFHAGVDVVAEGNRLFRPQPDFRRPIKQVYENRDQKDGQKRQYDRCSISLQCLISSPQS